jgi:hypothetical protein
MNMRNLVIFSVVFLLLAGSAFAASRTNAVASDFLPRWAPTATGSLTTEGGNVSETNLTGITLTDRWAGMFGNVSGLVVLTDSYHTALTLYNWSWSAANGGLACASQGTAFDFSAATAANAQNVDLNWSFGAATDNATNTFSGTCSDLIFTQKTVSNAIRISHVGKSTYDTCAITDNTAVDKTNFAFCSNISTSGTNYFGNNSNYELMVPVTFGAGQYETYYFYLELK